MVAEILKHKLAYAFLLIALITFTFGFFAVWPNRQLQRILVIGLAIFYFTWGLVTHVKSRKLTKLVVLEYLTTSLLAGILLLLVTL
ncbi:MAG: hypothetical protein COU63_03070 [Candidatus Pacebacteria bacterium CG10_big_fil_rev_8_21_14_0_10_36_11]|nr:hypothetical protein [Candidatus Pacearchaeota archaeon]OIP74408.1 MAG: hypothetical protein AUK08_01320 [Candidatus Pacebacteria bacterium CG2_30_36_39]PIR64970.1 MAG: hypothetical protein COU63_03070 [Candidatus Pacebacteria bacterium CG10_big_fil_rev_8_21_14_0_10_36_11]PJC42505.1 MAG: hypothetical protein CO040_04105 [Candidatus Pacebacteria bacterium CG_4_9_14_0_2_um_filter_36_8]